MKNEKDLTILVLNAAWDNRGDEAAIRAMIDSFNSKISTKNIKLMILSTDKINHFPSDNVELVNLNFFPYKEPKTIPTLFLLQK